jgi:hypothetical protein
MSEAEYRSRDGRPTRETWWCSDTRSNHLKEDPTLNGKLGKWRLRPMNYNTNAVEKQDLSYFLLNKIRPASENGLLYDKQGLWLTQAF